MRIDLRALRQSAGLDQKQLADKLGVHPSTVSNAENGNRKLSVDLLDQWVTICGSEIVAVARDRLPLVDAGSDVGVLMALAQLLPRLDEARISDLTALFKHWDDVL